MNVHGTLEVTTAKVCPVNCAPMCPQLAFRDVYGGKVDQLLSLENFKRAIASVPKEVRINFAGFAEPCVNPDFLEMLEFAKAEGHPVDLFTTLLGAKPDWIPRIKAVHPDNIVLHLPDNEGIAHLPPSEVYLKTLYAALKGLDITSFSRMSAAFGFVSNERAGNCEGAPTRHVWGPFHCARLTPAAFVMLPDCSCVLCCMDWRLKHRMGNLLTQTWQDLLDSAERRRLIKNSHRLDGDTLCRSCTFPISLKTLAPKRENAPVLGYLIREIGQRITSEA